MNLNAGAVLLRRHVGLLGYPIHDFVERKRTHMKASTDEFERIHDEAAIASLLDQLIESGGVLIRLGSAESDKGESVAAGADKAAPGGASTDPIVLMDQDPGKALELDLSAVDHLLLDLQEGHPFELQGQAGGSLVVAPGLHLGEISRAGGRYLCRSDYPDFLDVLQRRESFRAQLRLGMAVSVTLTDTSHGNLQGELRDLSQQGCRVELPMSASGPLVEAGSSALLLGFTFPDGTYFEVRGEARHTQALTDQKALQVGFLFTDCSTEQERQIWYFVCEIEREAARYRKEGEMERQPSPLFEVPKRQHSIDASVNQRELRHYATPMARRLVRVAAYLDAQMLQLQNGSDIDSRQLSRHADRLISLHDEDRQALLFATRCMVREPLLIRHSLSVAIHLLDLVGPHVAPDIRKAVAGSAMVHDLGKALVPQTIFQAPRLEATHRRSLVDHVDLIMARLGNCHWLAPAIAQAVIGGINERMDGSGYPRGLAGNQLHDLAKASAVIDVVEAMRRDRADRPARTTQQVYRHLLRHSGQFDPHWIKRYVSHFKALPVGSLVRFSSERMGWVLRLDGNGNPEEVQLTDQAVPPSTETLGSLIRGDIQGRLGHPVAEVAVST